MSRLVVASFIQIHPKFVTAMVSLDLLVKFNYTLALQQKPTNLHHIYSDEVESANIPCSLSSYNKYMVKVVILCLKLKVTEAAVLRVRLWWLYGL